MAHQRYSEHIYMKPEKNSNRFEISNCFEMSFCLHGNLGQVDSMEFAELAESAENHNFLSFKQPKELSLDLFWYLFTDSLSEK